MWSIVADVWLIAYFASALAIALDLVRGGGQAMPVMDVVWPVTALYAGPLGWAAYCAARRHTPPRLQVAVSVFHCGAGCTLGDIIGEFSVAALGFALLGSVLAGRLLWDLCLAWLLGIAFQYFVIVPMRHLSPRPGLRAAVRADTLSIVAFEAGLFAWMIFTYLVLFPSPHLGVGNPVFWLQMQIGM